MPRVAVVAVHGVADQEPGETNRAIAHLLANVDERGVGPAYTTGAVVAVQIPVRAIPVPDGARHAERSFEEYAAEERLSLASTPGRLAEPIDLAFTSSLLAKYTLAGPDDTYETTVRSMRRRPPSSDPSSVGGATDVDVFEMHWADLSRLTQSWWRMFAEVYQLLFHLADLGLHAINAARATEVGAATPTRWRLWLGLHTIAIDLLAHHTLFLNLYLIGLVLVLAAARPEATVLAWIVAGGLTVAGAVLVGRWCYRSPTLTRSAAIAAVGAGVLAAASAWLGRTLLGHPELARAILATFLVGGAGGAVLYVARQYEPRRPGAVRVALFYGAPLAALVLAQVWYEFQRATGPDWLPSVLLHSAEVVFFVLRIVWIVLLILGPVSWLVGRTIANGATGEGRERLDRTAWTAQLTLVATALGFLVLTTTLWFGIGEVVNRWTENFTTHEPLRLTKLLLWPNAAGHTVEGVVNALIANAIGVGFGLVLGLVGAAAFLTIMAIVPSIAGELRPPGPSDGSRGGRWLDSGFGVARFAGRLLVVALFVALPVPFVADLVLSESAKGEWWRFIVNSSLSVRTAVGLALGVGGAGLVVFGHRLKAVTLGFRSAVDVLLDVDNYLRERPSDSAPRARIMTRMASLLRHVYAQGYDSVVIIAHSQGTVITADLLRFLTLKGASSADPSLSRPAETSLHLFTMGSPLRQLYGLRFPHLYAWARHAVPCDPDHDCAVLGDDTAPDPRSLGVTSWVNAYRSGDYIGRYLWRREECPDRYRAPSFDSGQPWSAGPFPVSASTSPVAPPIRREFCIGAGAHTRYWHRSAPQIALELDGLICPRPTGSPHLE